MEGVGALTNSNQSLSQAMTGGQELGKKDFLELMVAQLKNQDPMNPQDGTEFTAQLAQFSSLEQLINMNESLSAFGNAQSQFQQQSALSMLGQQIYAEGQQFEFKGQGVEIGYELPEKATDASLLIKDANGQTVAKLTPEDLSKGEHYMQWNGTDNMGQPVPEGSYSVVMEATNGEEAITDIATLVPNEVTGVDMAGDGQRLVTPAGSFPFDKVHRVESI